VAGRQQVRLGHRAPQCLRLPRPRRAPRAGVLVARARLLRRAPAGPLARQAFAGVQQPWSVRARLHSRRQRGRAWESAAGPLLLGSRPRR